MPIRFERLSETRLLFEYTGGLTHDDIDVAHEQWLTALKSVNSKGQRVVLLADGTHSQGMSASQRRLAAEFAHEHEALIRRACAAQAVVLVSGLQRAVLTAVLWLKPPPTELRAFKLRSEAEAFLDAVERDRVVSKSA